MISIIYSQNKNTHELTIKGHAGYGKAGEDIYCSAVSILLYSLLESIQDSHLKQFPVVVLEPGESLVCVTAKEEYAQEVATVFSVILNGFRLLQINASEYVRLSE